MKATTVLMPTVRLPIPRPSEKPIRLDEWDLLDDNGDDAHERPTVEFDCVGFIIRNPCRVCAT